MKRFSRYENPRSNEKIAWDFESDFSDIYQNEQDFQGYFFNCSNDNIDTRESFLGAYKISDLSNAAIVHVWLQIMKNYSYEIRQNKLPISVHLGSNVDKPGLKCTNGKITKEMYSRIFSGVRLGIAKRPASFLERQKKYFQDRFRQCNKIALILPDIIARDYAGQSSKPGSTYMGTESLVESFIGFDLLGFVPNKIISRIKNV